MDWSIGRDTAEAAADCSLRVVLSIHRSGDYTSALALAGEAAELTERQLGPNAPLVYRIRSRAARALLRLGRFEESAAMHRELMEQCERELGLDAPETLENCLLLAGPLSNIGRMQEALPLLRRAVEGRTGIFGHMHPLTLIARKHLLSMAEAAAPAERDDIIAGGPVLMEDCRRELGADHTTTIQVELDYASSLSRAGRPHEALPHARSSVDNFRQCYGPGHPLTLNARTTLGNVLAELGQLGEAIEQTELVVNGRIDVLGPVHPHTILAKERLERYRSSHQ
ncbi:tetratricopeptide repeat protein [Streptomyces sp. NBC_01497]|uniref:tetratricopeptide repeat protein n=1 Tax=Streptomyces sp. NBC_01497 TaxID=2903885 RepID=UPI002E2FE0D2|nr:tetratricopeptide repeat protein [Streptomyces sp. NBC_01497]